MKGRSQDSLGSHSPMAFSAHSGSQLARHRNQQHEPTLPLAPGPTAARAPSEESCSHQVSCLKVDWMGGQEGRRTCPMLMVTVPGCPFKIRLSCFKKGRKSHEPGLVAPHL